MSTVWCECGREANKLLCFGCYEALGKREAHMTEVDKEIEQEKLRYIARLECKVAYVTGQFTGVLETVGENDQFIRSLAMKGFTATDFDELISCLKNFSKSFFMDS